MFPSVIDRTRVWLGLCAAVCGSCLTALPAGAQSEAPSLQSLPTSPAPASSTGLSSSRPAGTTPQLPSSAGQYWQEYDLRPYTKELNQQERPQQAIVDWILRETGTDVWFSDPFGFISADRDTLRVYHNQQMHEIVRRVHERFVNGTTAPQLYGMRLMALGNPNWRTRAHSLMRIQRAQSPGVNAFLLTKENTALLLALLRGRTDFRELTASDVVVHNGQAQVFEQLRGRNFVENHQAIAGAFPSYMPVTGEIKEGYRMQLSPLLSVDRQSVDLVVKCDIDQVERLTNVALELPTATGQALNTQIQVPQVVSWRLHERFAWPSDQVLILSCGIVAAPQGTPNNSLLGQGTSILGLDRLLPIGPGNRAEALLLIEYKGDASGRVATGQTSGAATTAINPLSRGRY
ncbi:MAG: hypothetical protein KF752_14735 [Pirellulaceae bacterium]|nr:hypothetical protein [Pirellulaceae bacterium]